MSAILCRIKEAKPNNFINHCKRYYFQIHTPRFINHQIAASQRLSDYHFIPESSKIQSINQRHGELFNSSVRFYAAPVQIKKKEEVVNPGRLRLNEEIKAHILRVVTDEGHTVLSRQEALKRAMELKLDLVEVDRNAKPPVCKIMDYNRERYKKQVREKERAKTKSAESVRRGSCKEIRFSAKTESKDLKMKADMVKRLMERGYRVKCLATGTEGQDLTGILSQLSALIEDDAYVEEIKPTYLIVRHVKFGMSKKGGKPGNKASQNKTAVNPEIHNSATARSDSPADLGEKAYEKESDVDNDEVEAPLQCHKESAWSSTSVSSSDQNLDEMFDLSHNVKGTSSSQEEQIRFDSKAEASTANNNASRFTPSGVPSFTDPNVRPAETENRYARSAAKDASAVKGISSSQEEQIRFERKAATSSANNNASRFTPPGVPSFTGPIVRPAAQETENRYARSAPKDASAVRNPIRNPNNDTKPQPQPHLHPISHPVVPPPKVSRQAESEGSPPINFRLPRDEVPRGEIQNQSSQPNNNLLGSIGHQQPPSNTGNPNNDTKPQPQPHLHPISHPVVSPPKVSRQAESEGSPPINFRLPRDEVPRGEIQNQSSQPNNNLLGSIGHQQPPSNTGNPRSQFTGFGTFSGTKVDAPKGPKEGGLEGSPFMKGLEDSPPLKGIEGSPLMNPQPKVEQKNLSSQPNLSDSIGYRQPPPPIGNLRSQSTGFGTFSSTKVVANNPNSASPSDVTRISSPGKVPGNMNPPISRPDVSKKSESSDKKWGIFSK